MTLEDWKAAARFFRFRSHDIAYWTAGDPSAPPLLLIHGFPTASWDWHAVWDDLARDHYLIACDMLGFGLSEKPRTDYSLHAQADLHLALLDHLGLTTTHVLAHDYGVSVAQELLARQNAFEETAAELIPTLDSIYFLNGGLIPGAHRPRSIQRLGISPLGFLVSLLLNKHRFSKSFSAVFGPDTQPTASELDDFWSLIAHKDGHRITHKLLGYMTDRTTHRDRWVGALRNTSIPLGILNGARDPVSGAHLLAAALREAPNLHATSLDDIGHYPQTEAPARVVEAYRNFRAGNPAPIR